MGGNNKVEDIEIINLVPKFIHFYEEAKKVPQDERWELWKEQYGFAAVPPGAQGEILARELLDSAWERYSNVRSYLENWHPDIERIQSCLRKIQKILRFQEEVTMVLIYFVGGFENNAFIAPYGDQKIALCLPVENGENEILLAHELTHILHAKMAELKPEWERTIASIIFTEGLAMHMSKCIVQGKPDEEYVEYQKGWLKECNKDSIAIFKGILPYLQDKSSECVYQFTMGNGTTGREREAYFVGWSLIPMLLKEGYSFGDIAYIQENEMVEIVREAINHVTN